MARRRPRNLPTVTSTAPLEPRADAWTNALTGLGVRGRDKTLASVASCVEQIDQQTLSDLFYGNALAAKIVNLRPAEMFREGYSLKGLDEEPRKRLEAEAERLGVDASVQEAMTWGRLRGGCLLHVGVDGASAVTEALPTATPATPGDEDGPDAPEDAGGAVRFLQVVDRRRIAISKRYDRLLEPKYGKPELYQIFPEGFVVGDLNAGALVHETRCIRFDGVLTDEREQRKLQGWTYSVLQRPYEVLRSVGTSFQSVEHLLSDASQGVWKIKNLYGLIAAGKEAVIRARMEMLDYARSVVRAVLLDSNEEDFERKPTNFAGTDAVLDRVMQRLAAACDIPVAILWGRSPAGLNATGESDIRAFYDTIRAEQKRALKPILLRLYKMIAAGLGIDASKLDIEFAPLWQMTPKERAEVQKLVADRDVVYITAEVLMPEQVAMARFHDGQFDYDAEPEVDSDFLEESLEASQEFALNPPPVPPPGTTLPSTPPTPGTKPPAAEGTDAPAA